MYYLKQTNTSPNCVLLNLLKFNNFFAGPRSNEPQRTIFGLHFADFSTQKQPKKKVSNQTITLPLCTVYGLERKTSAAKQTFLYSSARGEQTNTRMQQSAQQSTHAFLIAH